MAKDRWVSHGGFHKGGECGDGLCTTAVGSFGAELEEGLLHSRCFPAVLPWQIGSVRSQVSGGRGPDALAQLCLEASE